MPTRRDLLAAGAAVLAANSLTADEKPKTRTKFAVNVEMWWSQATYLKRLEEAAADSASRRSSSGRGENKDINAVAETCERLGLEIAQFTAWGFKPGLNDPKNHNQFVEKIDEELRGREEVEVLDDVRRRRRRHPGHVAREDARERHRGPEEGRAPVAEKHGVTLILEPMNIRVDHKGHCLYGSAPTMRIIKAVGSKFVKINWDLYHMHITEGDLCGHLREGFAADAIAYIQIADHPGRNEPGTGEIHYPRVFKELKALEYTGYVGLELVPKKGEEAAAKAVWAADAAW